MGWLINRRVLATIAALLAVVFLISLTLRERSQLTKIEEWLHDGLAPVVAGLHDGMASVAGAVKTVGRLYQLQQENEALREERDRLAVAQGELEEARREVERLQGLLELKEEVPRPGRAARIIGRSPSNWFETVTLDVGRQDGVGPDAVVVNTRGIVGKVVRVTEGTATVMLLTDAQTSVGATVTRSRYGGIILGGHQQAGRLLMRFFDYEADVEPGDRVVSSGLGGVFPANVPIGTVEKVERDPIRLLVLATVQPAVSFDQLDEVLVLDPLPPAEPAETDAVDESGPQPPWHQGVG